MRSLSDLRNEIDSLPKGNIYPKTIKGHVYWYRQYFESGKRVSVLIHQNELEEIESKILKRKELEEEYKRRVEAKNIVLSSAAKTITGQVMLGDIPVAKFENGLLIDIDEKRAPLSIVSTKDINLFLKLRVIDSSRTNARLLKKALGIKEADDRFVSLSAYAASISDNYWFKPKHSKLKYADIEFEVDAFSDLALKGDLTLFPAKRKLTPELTTTGSFEKGWKRVDGSWWLYKSGTKEELFSELFAYELAKLIGIRTAEYSYDEPYVRSKNFADEMNFEPAASFCGDNDDYEPSFEAMMRLGEDIAVDYLRLMMFDAWIFNVDRHNENYGIMRDRLAGEVISLAPNFDCNLSLNSRNKTLSDKPESDGLIKVFLRFVKTRKDVGDMYRNLDYADLSLDEISDALERVPKSLWPDNPESLCNALFVRHRYLVGQLKR